MKTKIWVVLAAIITLSLPVNSAEEIPNALKKVDVVERLGEKVSIPLTFTDENNQKVTFDSYFTQNKPVLLNIVYFSCPMLCNLVLDGFTDALKKLDPGLHDRFNILTVSMDPKDTPESARQFKGKYIEKVDSATIADNWHFLTGTQDQIEQLTNAVGFQYTYDAETRQYAHSAVVFALSPDQTISRYLYGITYNPFDLKMSVLEASKNKTISNIERVLLFCYNYDPQQRGYSLAAFNLMRVGGLITIILIGYLIYKSTESSRKINE